MGYPEHYVPTRHEAPAAAIRRLVGVDAEDLAARVEDPALKMEDRLAAGLVLGLVGDPRIRTFEPTMIDIAAADVVIGLDVDRVGAVQGQLLDTGVLPDWIAKECPSHRVALAAYRIARYPVTNFEYRDFLAATGYNEIPTSWELGRYPHERANHPVYTVSAAAADAYCTWLASRTGREFRLPSEAEWEHAAAGPARFEYPWGDAFEVDHANTAEAGLLSSTPVGAFPRGNSYFGACDLAGNVEEYVANDYYPYAGGRAVEDELHRAWGQYRVARGGCFTRLRDLARCKRRHGYFPKRIYAMGFRLAETA
ncbi:formylglycine-generating enzyme family protein [Roseateles sp. DXS20W]|uniref:Formylglycine-generating enzyme family protein n=2 Tax=Pelomonas lactea TaxID=3299030 RepID=A0ABW7GQP1_9BURK